MKYLSLTIPGLKGTPIDSGLPTGVPTGGLFDGKGAAGMGQITMQAFIILTVIVAILLALYTIIRGGLNIIQSGGDKERVKSGRQRVIYAIFGLIMLFLSFLFISVASAFFGFDLLPFLKFR